LLFSHLPGSLTPDYVNSNLPLAHVALLQLQGGGSLLGVRMSHFVGDWTSLRLLLRCFAAAYSNTAQQQQQQQQQLLLLPHLVPAAPLLNKLATALQQQQQQQQSGGGEGWVPLRLKPLQQEDTEKFAKLAAIGTQTEKDAHGAGSNGVDGSSGSNADGSSGSNCGDTDNSSSSSSQRPVRLSYQVSLERIKQLKQQLLAKAAPSSSSSNGSSRWCTTHNALLVSVLAAFGRLPSRQGLVHDVSIAADMRDRLPAAQLQLLGPQEQQQLGIAIGNFFASAIAEDCCLSGGSSRAQLAQALHAAVNRCVFSGWEGGG
jgi:hypothetical protein